MSNYKTIFQDILHIVLTIGLVGTAISQQLKPLVSQTGYDWIMLVFAGALLLVYYSDMIFGFPNTNVPTPPNSLQ